MKQYSRKNAWTMLVLALLAFCIHTRRLDRIPLTEDEETSIDIATGMGFRYENPKYAHVVVPLTHEKFTSATYWMHNQVTKVPAYTIADNGNNYVYNLLLHYWINIAGFSVFRLRLLSVLCTILTTLLLYRLTLKISSSYLAGIAAAVLFVLHPVIIIYSQIARSYALSLPLICAGIWLVYLLVEEGVSARKQRQLYIAFAAVSVLMVLTHYFNAVIVIYNLCALFFFGRKKQNLLPVAVTVVAILLPVVAWLLVSGTGIGLVQNFQSHVDAHAGQLPWLPEAKTLSTIFGMLAMLTAAFGNATLPDMSLKMWINIALLLPSVVLLVFAFRRTPASQRPFLWYITGAIGAFVLFALLVAIVSGHLFICQFRFWIFIIPYVMLLLAYGIRRGAFAHNRAYVLQAFAVLILLRAAFTGCTFFTDTTVAVSGGHITLNSAGAGYTCEPYETAASVIKEKYKPGYTVVYNNWRVAQNINWFLRKRPDIQQQADTLAIHRIEIRDVDGVPAWTFDALQAHENITGSN